MLRLHVHTKTTRTDRHTHMSVAGRAARCIRKACVTHSVQSPLPDSWLCKYRFICSSSLILFLLFSRSPRSLFSYPREEVAFLVFIRIIRNKETIGRDLRRDAATVCNNNNNNTIPTGGSVKERKCLEIVNIRTHRRALYNVCLPLPPPKPHPRKVSESYSAHWGEDPIFVCFLHISFAFGWGLRTIRRPRLGGCEKASKYLIPPEFTKKSVVDPWPGYRLCAIVCCRINFTAPATARANISSFIL